MPKSLAELQSSPDLGRPERTFPLCVAGKLVSELETADRDLSTAYAELSAARRVAEARRDGEAKPLRVGEESPVTAAEAKAETLAETVDAIRARMEDHTITLHLGGKTNGEWRRWASAHPARDEDVDKAGAQRDERFAGGFCNIDDLIAVLGDYVVRYDDDPASDAWREVAFTNAAPGDLTLLASSVVAMHEQGVDAGKSRVALLRDLRSETESD